MKKLTLSTLAALAIFSGCDSSSEEAVATKNENVQIQTENDVKKAVEAAKMISFFETGTSAANTETNAKQRINVDKTENCLVSGSVTLAGDVGLTSDVTSTFNECNNGIGSVTNGAVKVVASLADLALGSSEMTFTNFTVDSAQAYVQFNLSTLTDFSLNQTSVDYTLDGQIDFNNKIRSHTGTIVYKDFKVSATNLTSEPKLSYEGEITATSSLYPCLDGTYVYETISPLIGNGIGNVSDGELNINGANFVFSNGSVTVTTASGATINVAQEDEPSCE